MEKNEIIKLSKINIELDTKQFNLNLNVDSSALFETNAREYFRVALIGENSSRSRFRIIPGIKDREKVAEVIATNLLRKGDTPPDFSNTEIKQNTYEVCPVQVSTLVNIDALESSFMSDTMAKGANNYSDTGAFFSHFYETLSKVFSQELEYLTWRGSEAGFSPAIEYLEVCDGLEIKLSNNADVLTPASPATAVTSSNVIAKLIEARDTIPTAVKLNDDYAYQVAPNVYDALMDAVSDNKNSGLYYMEGYDLAFQGVKVYKCDGMSDNVIVAGQLSNFLYLLDGISDDTAFTVVDFLKTTLYRRLGMRTDIKFCVDFLKPQEIYFHKPA